MKKLLLFIGLTAFVMIVFTSCSAETYSFKEPIAEIESIEIVSAENSLEFTVIKTLSETEKNDFLEQFRKIEFQKGFVGDPTDLYGDSIKITYQSGVYEMICFFTAEYVQDGKINFVRKSCDEKIFNDLLDSFLKED